MTVRELIAELEKYPEGARVNIASSYGSWGYIDEVKFEEQVGAEYLEDGTAVDKIYKTVWIESDVCEG